MKHNLTINSECIRVINNYFSQNLDTEKCSILYFSIDTDPNKEIITFNIKGAFIPPEKAVLVCSKDCVKLDPRFIKHCIRFSKENNYGFLLAHNHPLGTILKFSRDDLETERKILSLVFKNNPIQYHGSILFYDDSFSIRILKENTNNLLNIDTAYIKVNEKYKLITGKNNEYKFR